MQNQSVMPFAVLCLYRTDRDDFTLYQSENGLYDAGEYTLLADYEIAGILKGGDYIAVGSYTDTTKIPALIDYHQKMYARCPALLLRNADSSDIMPILKHLEAHNIPLRLSLDRPECYAEEFRHLYPEL